ncbi:MAG: phenylalanine--tRNA ligase subunit alpha [Candidatus Eisenbacteria bacterium]|uniref:Phenylalanine--tRNA ligase alpha subunit n=1 Tax=Eiseniibacteriota bacterium TaxID=2212470 RepID=A0A538SWY5_UNCEI|nr:MAG: phenylalanine--tRNA ligase subunit alpha [Candidatus Eisenbacteria bacterium]
MERLDALEAEAARALEAARDESALEEARVRHLGRKSELTQILRGLKDLSAAERASVGARANRLRETLERCYEEARGRLETAPAALARDVTLPGRCIPRGHEHLISQVLGEIHTIFLGMGFALAEGPDVEDDRHNFGALNMPEGHPARATTDTFYLRPDVLLRTHTSSVQIRVMESHKPPVRIICPGRAYRNEAVDATHHFEFHQLEGLYVDEDVSLADLKGTLDRFLKEFFGPETELRFSPSYFPFVEPGAQVEIRCFFCGGKGCSVCGPLSGGWLEVLGAGMVHPNVFRAVGYDPERWTGFAFGAGIERLVMLRHGVPDIRLFYEGDVRFLHQF